MKDNASMNQLLYGQGGNASNEYSPQRQSRDMTSNDEAGQQRTASREALFRKFQQIKQKQAVQFRHKQGYGAYFNNGGEENTYEKGYSNGKASNTDRVSQGSQGSDLEQENQLFDRPKTQNQGAKPVFSNTEENFGQNQLQQFQKQKQNLYQNKTTKNFYKQTGPACDDAEELAENSNMKNIAGIPKDMYANKSMDKIDVRRIQKHDVNEYMKQQKMNNFCTSSKYSAAKDPNQGPNLNFFEHQSASSDRYDRRGTDRSESDAASQIIEDVYSENDHGEERDSSMPTDIDIYLNYKRKRKEDANCTPVHRVHKEIDQEDVAIVNFTPKQNEEHIRQMEDSLVADQKETQGQTSIGERTQIERSQKSLFAQSFDNSSVSQDTRIENSNDQHEELKRLQTPETVQSKSDISQRTIQAQEIEKIAPKKINYEEIDYDDLIMNQYKKQEEIKTQKNAIKVLKKKKREQSKSLNRTNVIQEESKATTYAEPQPEVQKAQDISKVPKKINYEEIDYDELIQNQFRQQQEIKEQKNAMKAIKKKKREISRSLNRERDDESQVSSQASTSLAATGLAVVHSGVAVQQEAKEPKQIQKYNYDEVDYDNLIQNQFQQQQQNQTERNALKQIKKQRKEQKREMSQQSSDWDSQSESTQRRQIDYDDIDYDSIIKNVTMKQEEIKQNKDAVKVIKEKKKQQRRITREQSDQYSQQTGDLDSDTNSLYSDRSQSQNSVFSDNSQMQSRRSRYDYDTIDIDAMIANQVKIQDQILKYKDKIKQIRVDSGQIQVRPPPTYQLRKTQAEQSPRVPLSKIPNKKIEKLKMNYDDPLRQLAAIEEALDDSESQLSKSLARDSMDEINSFFDMMDGKSINTDFDLNGSIFGKELDYISPEKAAWLEKVEAWRAKARIKQELDEVEQKLELQRQQAEARKQQDDARKRKEFEDQFEKLRKAVKKERQKSEEKKLIEQQDAETQKMKEKEAIIKAMQEKKQQELQKEEETEVDEAKIQKARLEKKRLERLYNKQRKRELEKLKAEQKEIEEKERRERIEQKKEKLRQILQENGIEMNGDKYQQSQGGGPDFYNQDDEKKKKKKKKDKRDKRKKDNGIEVVCDEDSDETCIIEEAPKYYQPGLTPQAPLKQIQINAYDYFIDKLLDKSLKIDKLRKLYATPVPALVGQILCTIERTKASGIIDLFQAQKFSLTLSQNDQPLLVAEKVRKLGSKFIEYQVRIDNEQFQQTENQQNRELDLELSQVRSNLSKNEFLIEQQYKGTRIRQQGLIQHIEQTSPFHQMGTAKKLPRPMNVYIPMVSREGKPEKQFIVQEDRHDLDGGDTDDPEITMQNAILEGHLKNIAYFTSRKPRWSKKTQTYALNFNGRVTQGSRKNFQLVDRYDDSKIYLQFGKIDNDTFNMDCAFPFSIMQAFSLCVTMFEWQKNKDK